MVKILIDSAIPYINGVLEPYAEVCYKKGGEITAVDVRECDALIVRTRTRCDAALLDGSSVRFIGTATIGFDHIDLDYCKKHSIEVATAAGCNAIGVAQYVVRAVEELEKIQPIRCIGVVGVGNVGREVSNCLTQLGYDVLLNDPPRAAIEPSFKHTPLEDILPKCDLVTFHVPLNDSTSGMVSSDVFEKIKRGAFFINSSRGEVVNEKALLRAIDDKVVIFPVIDVWCHEPHINKELLQLAFIATPHIAGYSAQGKANGTAIMVHSVAKFFGLKNLLEWYPVEVRRNIERKIVTRNYNILSDSELLKNNKEMFEDLRNNYNYRQEFF